MHRHTGTYTERGGSLVKKTILVLAIMVAIIPAMAFADFQIGVVAGDFAAPISYMDSGASISSSDLAYGLEARLKLWILQAGVSAFYMPSIETVYMLTDAGVALDLLFLRVGAGVGPNLLADTQGGGSQLWGWNLKTTFDINLGNLGLGLITYTAFDSFANFGYVMQNFMDYTYLGVTLMFRIF
jgi:hypothetical protein